MLSFSTPITIPKTDYVFDGSEVIQEKAGYSLATHYTRGLGGRIISRGGFLNTPSYYHHDAIGSVVGLSGSGGSSLTDTYSYDAFGNELKKTGTSAQPFRYLGNAYDTTSGLYDFHARSYNPKNGRFTSEDPLKGLASLPQSLNPYACSINNPLRFPDPLGLQPSEIDHGLPLGKDAPPEEGGGEDCSQYTEGLVAPNPDNPEDPSGDVEGILQDNIEESEYFASQDPLGYYFGVRPGAEYLDDAQYFDQIKPGGEYDYKSGFSEDDPQYEPYAEFGNFNFGATGAARGYPEEELLQGAEPVEAYERYNKGYDPRGGLEEGETGLLPSDYDTYDDQQVISQGYDYYECLNS